MNKTQISPPDTFTQVESGIYRSESIKPNHFNFIKQKNIKTLISLSAELPSKAVQNFLIENNIELVHLGSKANQYELGWRPISEEMVKEGLEIMLNRNKLPILVTCISGLHETGAFIGCFRKLQDWNFNSIVVEYRSLAKSKSRLVIEQFIELFDLDLITLPSELPDWFEFHLKLKEEEQKMI